MRPHEDPLFIQELCFQQIKKLTIGATKARAGR
jgi:hypothetical protein